MADFIGAGNFIPVSEINASGKNIKAITDGGGEIIIGKIPDLNSRAFRYRDMINKIKNEPKTHFRFVFFIRPEKLKVSSRPLYRPVKRHIATGLPVNHFTAKIISRVFEGPDTRLTLFLSSLGKLIAEVKNDEQNREFQEGENIYVYWNIKDGCLLEK